MKKMIVLGAALTALVGCSDSTSTDELKSTVTNALLNGTWKSECVAEGSISFTAIGTFKDGTGSFDSTEYSDTTCTNVATVNPTETFSYTLGNTITVDGSVAGLTSATEINMTDTTPGSATLGEKSFDIFAIKDLITLYAGDDSGTNDGSTAALRPTKLWDVKFTQK